MLIAEVAGQPERVRTIWSWTNADLGRPDGLFASHASGAGEIEDPQSATDVDILIAYALLRFAGPDQAALHRAGRRVAEAVLALESVTLPDGSLLPVAGPWARSSSPPTVDPSYLMPGVFVALARFTGDDRWNGAAGASIALIDNLTDGGRRLPPDWAQLSDGRLLAIANPGGGAGVQYGFDAARLPIWFATACSRSTHRLAAGWWSNILAPDGRSGEQALTLDGGTIDAAPSPLQILAGAREDPTYYGDAWVALAPALLDGSISPCDEIDAPRRIGS